MTTVSAYEARRKLGRLLQMAFYKNTQVRIKRNNKPIARLVGEPMMAALEKVLDANPRLMDTLAILLDAEIMAAIRQGDKEVAAGKTMPIESVLET